jgi:hypothetical protein
MAASAPERNISGKAASIRCSHRALLPSRTRPQPCIRGQLGYLEGVMIKLVKNLRLLVHGGCLKAGW